MTDFSTRSAQETKTLRMLHAVTSGDDWTQDRAILALVWKAMWQACLSQKAMEQIGAALAGYANVSDVDLTAAIEFFWQKKILRKRRGEGGVTLYEVRY